MNTVHTRSLLHPLIQQYMALQQALGRRYHTEHYVLAGLDRFLARHMPPDLTAETFAAWCRTQSHLKPGVRRARLRMVRNFCLYRQRTDPQCFVPDQHAFPAPHQPIHLHLFTEYYHRSQNEPKPPV
jgi:integrase/recombinase XerD